MGIVVTPEAAGHIAGTVARSVRDHVRSEMGPVIAAYEQALWDIYVATGAGTDRNDGPGSLIAGMGREGFARLVLESVRELRAGYAEALAGLP